MFLIAACGTDRKDPCDGAKPGDACRWAGTGVQGLNREQPRLDRLDSMLDEPSDVVFGPDGRAYIIDFNNHMVRRVERDQTLTVVIGTYEGDGAPDHSDSMPACAAAGAPGTEVALNHPTSATFGADGLLYIASWHNNKIRTFDPETGIVKVVAGNFYGFYGDGGPGCQALFNQPSSLAFGADGTMYIADQRNVRLRKIDGSDGLIHTIAGDGRWGNIGDGGPAALAEFGWDATDTPPVSGSVVPDGDTLYIADSGNHRIREIDLVHETIDCIAGLSGTPGYSGDGGPALAAQFDWPLGMALGPDHKLYVADRSNNAVRAIDLATKTIETVVGDGNVCDTYTDHCPDRAPALEMELNQPSWVSFDGDGNLYVVDKENHRIVKVFR